MKTLHSEAVLATLAFAFATATASAGADVQSDNTDQLDKLTTPAERAFLMTELARVHPPGRLKDLAEYGSRQSKLGGGFYGMLPAQLADPDSLPLPLDESARLAAALVLAEQRAVNLEALAAINPDYTLTFGGASLSSFLDQYETVPPSHDLSLDLDVTALSGFFAGLTDGEITTREAATLARLTSNQAMLQHRRDLGYVPEPLPDTDSLAEMIRIAGSTDPLDRLWCWINPQNAFNYADLVQNADGYRQMLGDLETHGDDLVNEVLSRIEPYTPAGTRFRARFAMTVGWAIRGWATPEMAGLNIEQAKDDWPALMGTLIEETYHRLQLELFPSPTGSPAGEFSDLVLIETGDERYDRLFEILFYTVAEGAANRVRGPLAATDLPDKVPAGAELMSRFVAMVVEEGDLDSADALISEGLKGNGPLYGLGWKLASLIEDADGKRQVGILQARGAVAFFLRGASIAESRGETILASDVIAAIETLDRRMQE